MQNLTLTKILTLIIATCVILTPTFSIATTAQTTTSNSNTFILGYGGTPFDTFNPFTTYTVVSTMSTIDVYDTLVKLTPNFSNPVPDLAYKWTIYPNNSAAVFYLVKNATWSDGVPVTAQDVVYSYELASNNVSRLQPNVAPIISVEAINNYTVEIHYHPTLLLINNIISQVPIVPKHVWEKYVPDPLNATALSDYQDYPLVSSGPFTVSQYVQGQYIELTANPHYFYKTREPHIKNIVIQFFKDSNTMVAALESGQIDAVAPTIQPAQISSLESGYPNIKVVVEPGEELWYIGVNVYPYGHGNPTLKDLQVRKALAYAINTTELAQVIWRGYATPAAGLLPVGNAYHDPNLKPYPFNLTLANLTLEEAGYKMGPNGIRVSPNGVPLSYTLYVINSDPEEIQAANIVAGWWKQIGVQANVVPEDGGALANIIWPNFTQDFDLWDWYTSPAVPTLLSVFLANQTETGISDSGYNNSSYDKLYGQMLTATSQAQLKEDAYQLQAMLYNDLPYLMLYYVDSIEAYNTHFSGLYTNMTGGPFSDVNWLTFLDLQPAHTSSTTSSDVVPLAGALVVAIAVISIALYLKRRGST
ncbi:MAG: peptide ABC transporter substrate-binding protein [Candidatus Marsarchaeota archaeon]|nr:peptide ABC transporter substrate-binding protein [Candidatus Marsarchaeota archaeon]